MSNYDVGTQSTTARRGTPVLWFMIGGVLGAGIALLTAPASGRETRRRIGQTSRQLGSRVQNGVNRVRGHMSGLKDDVQTAVNSGRDTFNRERDARLGTDTNTLDQPRSSLADQPRTP